MRLSALAHAALSFRASHMGRATHIITRTQHIFTHTLSLGCACVCVIKKPSTGARDAPALNLHQALKWFVCARAPSRMMHIIPHGARSVRVSRAGGVRVAGVWQHISIICTRTRTRCTMHTTRIEIIMLVCGCGVRQKGRESSPLFSCVCVCVRDFAHAWHKGKLVSATHFRPCVPMCKCVCAF